MAGIQLRQGCAAASGQWISTGVVGLPFISATEAPTFDCPQLVKQSHRKNDHVSGLKGRRT
jgi:hypothetical protein